MTSRLPPSPEAEQARRPLPPEVLASPALDMAHAIINAAKARWVAGLSERIRQAEALFGPPACNDGTCSCVHVDTEPREEFARPVDEGQELRREPARQTGNRRSK